MLYFNINLSGLTWQPHPSLHYIHNSQDIQKVRSFLKLLTYDLTNLSSRDNRACCGACLDEIEGSIPEHLLLACKETSDVRSRLYPELVNSILQVHPENRILRYHPPNNILAQFILDCTSINLPTDVRIPQAKCTRQIFRVARDWCHAVLQIRNRSLSRND